MKKILGIDYGEKRMGLALASTPLAEPYKIIDRENATKEIKDICHQEKITDIVIGISENQTEEKTRDFINQLSSMIDISIFTQDETLSSHEVKEMFLEAGKKKSKVHGHIDHYAASLILQDYIDENKCFE